MNLASSAAATRPFGESLFGKMKLETSPKIHPATRHKSGALGLHLAHGSTLQSAMPCHDAGSNLNVW